MQLGIAEQPEKYIPPQKKLYLWIPLIAGGHLSTHTHGGFSVTYNLIIMSTQNISVLPFFFLICKKCTMEAFTSQLQEARNISCVTFSHTFYMNMLNSFKCHSQYWRLLGRLEAWMHLWIMLQETGQIKLHFPGGFISHLQNW